MIVAIDGPIASGKSTLAKAVVRELASRGVAAAIIDLDHVYEMLDQGAKDRPDVWDRARAIAVRIARVLLDSVDVVVVEGGFDDRSGFEDARFVSLRVTLDVALVRVEADATRGLSRDRGFLTRHYANLAEPRVGDLVLDTSAAAPAEQARAIASWI